jgi:type IV secretion system protein VirB8
MKSDTNDVVASTRNWYQERYENTLVQRNILLLIVLLSVVLVTTGVIVSGKIIASKSVEPFVIEIEPRTGITNVVNPVNRENITTNRALAEYFIVTYIRSRETYNVGSYDYNVSNIVRVLSAGNVYQSFRVAIAQNPQAPAKIYADKTSTTLELRSIQFLDDSTAQVRFKLTESGIYTRTFNKIATLKFEFRTITLTNEERHINPLGFTVTSYSVDEEILR